MKGLSCEDIEAAAEAARAALADMAFDAPSAHGCTYLAIVRDDVDRVVCQATLTLAITYLP